MGLPATTFLNSWQPTYSNGDSGTVYSIADLGDGRIVIGGEWDNLTSHDGQTVLNQPYFACFDKATMQPTSFAPTFDYYIKTFLVLNGKLYVGGYFSTVNSEARGYGCAFDLATNTMNSWDPGVEGEINSLVANGAGDKIYIGGDFGRFGGGIQATNRRCVGAVDLSGALLPWNPFSNSAVSQLWWDDNKVYIASGISGNINVGGSTDAGRGSACRVDDVTAVVDETFNISQDTSWFTSQSNAILVTADTVWLAGEFTVSDGAGRNHLAAFDKSGNLLSFNANLEEVWGYGGTCLALSTDGSTIFMGTNVGNGYNDDSMATKIVAGYDIATGAKVWDPIKLGSGSPVVNALYYDSGDKLYVGGLWLPNTTDPMTTDKYALQIYAQSAGGGVSNQATTTTLTSSPNPSTNGQSVTLTATVVAGTGTPTGVVTFKKGSTILGSGTVNGSGVATLAISNLSVGSNSLSAEYAGDTGFDASVSSSHSHTVNSTSNGNGNGKVQKTVVSGKEKDKEKSNPGQDKKNVVPPPPPVIIGEPPIIVVIITPLPPETETPTGTVTVTVGDSDPITKPLDDNGETRIVIPVETVLETGEYPVQVDYSGDSNYESSPSSGEDNPEYNIVVVVPTPPLGTTPGCRCDLYQGVKCVNSRYMPSGCLRPTYQCSQYLRGAYVPVVTICQQVAAGRMTPSRLDWKELN